MKSIFSFFLIITLFSNYILPQERDISTFLKRIDAGEIIEVKKELVPLLKQTPYDPGLLYLDALLTENSVEASSKYQKILEQSPKSKYADACLYRLYAYNYAIGSYRKAQDYLFKLKKKYPNSSFIKLIEEEQVIDNQKPIEQKQSTTSNIDGKYTIQAGAFSNLNNANELKSELEETGLKVEVIEKSVAGTVFHVVYAGNYKDEKSALPVLNKINKDFNLNARIISRK